ncbi:hypothetical protein ACFFX0_32675 [Citricoccus parietis]|uniref:Uncharacterized protein n=1 Tax=Citricoccus parietis TaxID=592307 RepID=A0ABV5G9V5_9MICC
MVVLVDSGDVEYGRSADLDVFGGGFGEHRPVHPGWAQGNQCVQDLADAQVVLGVIVVGEGHRPQCLRPGADVRNDLAQQRRGGELGIQVGQGGGDHRSFMRC